MLEILPELKAVLTSTQVFLNYDVDAFENEYRNLPKLKLEELTPEQALDFVTIQFPLHRIPLSLQEAIINYTAKPSRDLDLESEVSSLETKVDSKLNANSCMFAADFCFKFSGNGI